MQKLRMSWTRLGQFDYERGNSEEIKAKKLACMMTVGVTSLSASNSKHSLWKMATTPTDFFETIIKLCNMHSYGQITGQKINKVAQKKAKKTRDHALPVVDWNNKYSDNLAGSNIPNYVFVNLSWIKQDADFSGILKFLINVTNGLWTLQHCMEMVQRYKAMKYIRIQITQELGSHGWQQVLNTYGAESFGPAKLLTLTHRLPVLTLTAAPESEQGWFEGPRGKKTTHILLLDFILQVKHQKVMVG